MADSDIKDEFLDWKITVLFYCALHKIKEHLCKKGVKCIDMETHKAISDLLKEDRYKLPDQGNSAYSKLYQNSRESRYNGIETLSGFNSLMKGNFNLSQNIYKDLLTHLKKCTYK